MPALDQELYPQHAKLQEIAHLSQACFEFLEWLGEQKIHLGEYLPESDFMVPVATSWRDLLARHYGIDLDKLENEKRAMLDAFRNLQQKGN